MITLNEARTYEELLEGGIDASPYDYASLFAGDSAAAKRRARKRFQLLKKIDARLNRLLRTGERVVFACKGSVASLEERFFAGHAVAYHINLRALVFTSRRVILLRIGTGGRPLDLVSELPYTSILRMRSTWTGLLVVKLINGRSHRFSGIRRADRAFLQDFIEGIVRSTRVPFVLDQQTDGLRHLCPHCFSPVAGRPRACASCGGGIKAATTAALLSLGFPGLGNVYLGHAWFGLFEMIGAAMLWLVLVLRPLQEEISHIDSPPLGGGFWLFALAIMGGMHVIDAVVTYSFALKGHHPGRAPKSVAASG